MADCLAVQIVHALAARIESIKVANGYETDIKSVYHEIIPMGLELMPEDLPTVFLLDDGAQMEHEHQLVNVTRAIRFQIVDIFEATDSKIFGAYRDIAKAIFANSPTAQVQDQFRFHDRVVWVQIDSDEGDLHMIESNRIATFRVIVHYRTRPYDL